MSYIAVFLLMALGQHIFAHQTSTTAISRHVALQECLVGAVDGQYSMAHFPGDTQYLANDVKPYNLNDRFIPAAVMYPKTAAHVSQIVLCSRKFGKTVQARSGGHDTSNKSLGQRNGTVVVDLQKFTTLHVDTDTGVATVGPGNKLKDLVYGLHDAGGRYMSHGSSSSVGIGGHATVAGLGYQSRHLGSALDMMLEAQVVLANGSIVRASETDRTDLFWAVRGAAQSFGIVTEFKFRTNKEPTDLVDFTYTISSANNTVLAEAYEAYQGFVGDQNLDHRFSSVAVIQKNTLSIAGSFFGPEPVFSALGLEQSLPHITKSTIHPNVGWVQHMEGAFEFVDGVFPSHSYFATAATGITYSTLSSRSTIDKLLDHLQVATGNWFFLADLYGGSVNDIPASATAYPHRNIAYYASVYHATERPTSGSVTKWVDQTISILEDGYPDHFGCYAGYSNERIKDPQRKFWGGNLPRLSKIKSTYDPLDIFSTPQGVKPYFGFSVSD